MLSVADVKARIEGAFAECTAEVSDPRGSSNYFEAVIVSPDFAGLARIKRHRTVMALFDPELKAGSVHALTLKAYTPEELAARG